MSARNLTSRYTLDVGRASRKLSSRRTLRYLPEADHKDLVLEGTELWVQGPELLRNLERARSWQEETGRLRSDDPEHLERVREAFLYEIVNGHPGPGPFYRGQWGTSAEPHLREEHLSWSRDPEVAFTFAALHPVIVGQEGARPAPPLEELLESGELAPGESLHITAFVLDKSTNGLDINHTGKDALITNLIEDLEAGRDLEINVRRGNKTEKIAFRAQKTKIAVYKAALQKAGEARVKRALGVGNLTGDQVARFIAGRNLAQMNAFLKRLGEPSVSEIWNRRIETIRQAIKDARSLTGNHYAHEEEVVLPSSSVQDLRRVDVCLANSPEELEKLTEREAQKLFLEAIG